MKKVLVLIVVTLCSFTANSALSDTINLLSIWEADKNNSLGGVDIDGDGSIDQHYGVCVPSCQVTAGSIAQITSVAFWQGAALMITGRQTCKTCSLLRVLLWAA